eukprot:comp21284_c0_seq1/m.29052 comp21284_c0_seq1/g.29052  ORF comp21284_c0_seq1/g.29052 comp21284_c0_seq1/m.29052 type:complete len:310 (-) comp21284_c0_seq1:657-1586(-)
MANVTEKSSVLELFGVKVHISYWAKDFVAGTVAGMAGVLAGHPFDTVKVRMQCQTKENRNSSIVGLLRHIVKTEKVTGIYKGMASPMAGVGLINAMLFGVYGLTIRAMKDTTNPHDGGHIPLLHAFVAGSVSGGVNALVSCPIELVKTRLQMQTQTGASRALAGPVDATLKILRGEGTRGLYRGFWATVIREVPSYGAYFWCFEFLCQSLQGNTRKRDELGSIELLLVGGLSGIGAWLTTYPSDVVKTRLQAQSPQQLQYTGIRDCVHKLYHAEGVGVFFHGLRATVVRAFPVNAVTFFVYTLAMERMN